jgi:Flp pilus assembly pilin Flp
MEQSKMLLRCVAKLFALKPKANAIEAGIITALVVAALLSSVLAVRDPLASFYDAVVGNFVVGTR